MMRKDLVAKEFIKELKSLMETFLNNEREETIQQKSAALKEKFDTFAIIEKFSSFIIIDCFNQIKISLQKWERFANKKEPLAKTLKQLLDYFYSIMREIYFYEIFGFFSTTVWPSYIPNANLPCRIFCGCAKDWEKEPCLDKNGKAVFTNVVRFANPNGDNPLCITIKNPHLLEPRKECNLTDKQLEKIIQFVRVNKDVIIDHYNEITDSRKFIDILKQRYGAAHDI
ncbi:MAG: hypothetical protein IK024_10805 [Treponema sp.]|nr:hypothetical protein [Treponema sp.]